MNFKKTLYISFLYLTFLSSCKKNSNDLTENDTTKIIDTFPHIEPDSRKLKVPTAKFVEEKKVVIDGFYKKYWQKNKVSGSFLVAKNGKIIFEKYAGYANYEKKDSLTQDTPIHLASVSKVLTAAATMELVHSGKIKLDQKVNTILKTFPYEEITVRTLLNHRSGLTNYAYYFDDREKWNHSKLLTNQDILDLFIKYDAGLDFKTDKKFAYCNTNYAMLALIIEKITGMHYAAAMKKIIFEPLGMKHTFVIDFEKDITKVSQSYKGNYKKYELNHLDQVYGDKNIYSTARDLLKFDLATSSPDYLTPDLVEEIYKGYSYERRGTRNYGLGIRMLEWEDGEKLFYHNGWWHGNTSSFVKLKKEDVVIIALANKYTTMTYKSFHLATIFGDYPLKVEKGDLGD
ncbi:CubicO group peptidase (beta-lactamase class C family) [Flavobacterium arsenatis]|uniref:CubicO group peptidase (Beta-lactamase class C family) n=1 Tax=Flavobacterium arsenatis TaxID=1484332 RepID=A0ABU1TMU2_9FLAO|nr:serine hydrolase domain-containing protein [Flavobacterium arsenatis]MDR6967281.1 CubicO group peptidase (beta-lactamase class C family) [Flavobacterium arsenatis]